MQIVSAADAVAGIASGQQVFVHGGAATPSVLLDALVARADELRDVGMVHFHTEGPGPHLSPSRAAQPAGEPAPKESWASLPDGTPIDFLTFARTEGRFAPHFGSDGTPTAEMIATQEDRLANWHTLQELAGTR